MNRGEKNEPKKEDSSHESFTRRLLGCLEDLELHLLGLLARNVLTVVAIALLIGSPAAVYIICSSIGVIYPSMSPLFYIAFVGYVPFVFVCAYLYVMWRDRESNDAPQKSAIESLYENA